MFIFSLGLYSCSSWWPLQQNLTLAQSTLQHRMLLFMLCNINTVVLSADRAFSMNWAVRGEKFYHVLYLDTGKKSHISPRFMECKRCINFLSSSSHIHMFLSAFSNDLVNMSTPLWASARRKLSFSRKFSDLFAIESEYHSQNDSL